jgi:phosphate transport system substrate-binding protein
MQHSDVSRLGLAAVVSALVGCAPSAPSNTAANPAAHTAANVVRLVGGGATFPAPLYNKWCRDYSAKHPDVQVEYRGAGSGGSAKGVDAIVAGTLDFGASDMPLSDAETAQVEGGVVMVPMTAGSIVVAYNLPGVATLKLSRAACVGIFTGHVKKWNDPLIAKTNAAAALPDQPLHVVVRADSAGSSFVFTKYLSTVSDTFAGAVGADKLPNWPAALNRAKGKDGLVDAVKSTPGAIGYVEYSYAQDQSVSLAFLENKAGQFVGADPESCQAALNSTKLPENLVAWVADPGGEASYPVVTYTWVFVNKKAADAKKWAALKDVLIYGLTEGQEASADLGFVPLPASVVQRCKTALDTVQAVG